MAVIYYKQVAFAYSKKKNNQTKKSIVDEKWKEYVDCCLFVDVGIHTSELKLDLHTNDQT